MNITILKEIVRWGKRNRTTTILSISGMAIGIAVALLIGFWSLNEFSFDKFHSNADQIYRVCRQGYINNESTVLGSDFGIVGTTAKEQIPEIEEVCRVINNDRQMIKIKERTYYEDLIGTADANLFRFFSFKLLNGNPATCLDGPNNVVISRSMAEKYFQSENPIGEIIEIFGRPLQVSAIMENMPDNSHLKFSVVIAMKALPWYYNSQWGTNDNYLTYLRVKKNANIAAVAKGITAMTYKNFPIYEKFKIEHFLQPLKDIHFSSGFRFDYVRTSDSRIIFIFISLAVLILLIASFNFINLFISTSFLRAKSIGVKKINGSSKTSLFISSYIETALYIVVATCIAFALVALALPIFNQIAGTNLHIDFGNPQIYLFTTVLLFVTILIAGTTPVLYILRFNPEAIIRNRFKSGGVTVLQRVLVVSQFVASIVLISSAGIIQKQIAFVKAKDLGFDKEQIIYFYANNMADKYSTIREELLSDPNILDVTAKSSLPFEWNNGNNISSVDNPSKDLIMEVCAATYNYTDMMKMPLVNGRNPFISGENKPNECMINEKAATSLELTDPIGKQIKKGETVYTIAGVLKNVNTKSLHLQVDPQVYTQLEKVDRYHPILVKTSNQVESAIKTLSAVWTKTNPDIPFEYFFLDDAYGKLYKIEDTASKIISAGMVIALFLAFMGLYAISHYATERRIKEIGLRKVNGARISEVLILLNRDFIRWILISVAIATPLTWYVLHKWLANFAYKTSLSWWIFVLSGLMAIGIAVLTVSWQSWKAATRNPVEALRYE
jgi:putative ABC transport system permease protein